VSVWVGPMDGFSTIFFYLHGRIRIVRCPFASYAGDALIFQSGFVGEEERSETETKLRKRVRE
jgi:hypothetical protein